MSKLEIIPRLDTMHSLAARAAEEGKCDAQLAPIWAEKLRHTYAQVLETEYPEYMAEAGKILPVDTEVDPGADEWEDFQIDSYSSADWIDDDGQVAPNGAIVMTRRVGKMHNIGHEYDWTLFDLERAAMAKLPLQRIKADDAKRAHAAKTDWAWMFGDSALGIEGLCNHPNITVSMAALNGGSTSRRWANKTADEIATDMSVLINTIATNTLQAYTAATVFMPLSLFHRLRDLRLGAGDGFASVLGWMESRFSGDASGQGKIEFRILNSCSGSLRRNPKTGTDTSGISGDFLLAIPKASKERLSFIRARPFTQLPPEQKGFSVRNLSHSKIGGCRMQIPLAVHRLDFGLT